MSTDRSSLWHSRVGGCHTLGAAYGVRVVALMLGGAAFVFALPSLIHVLVWRTRRQPGLDALRWSHKNVDSHRVLKTAGKRQQTLAVVHHTGRSSGREYLTPVWAHRVGESFFIGLPYGTHVDWLQNARAADGCGIEHDGVLHHAVAPVVLPVEDAPSSLPARCGCFAEVVCVPSSGSTSHQRRVRPPGGPDHAEERISDVGGHRT